MRGTCGVPSAGSVCAGYRPLRLLGGLTVSRRSTRCLTIAAPPPVHAKAGSVSNVGGNGRAARALGPERSKLELDGIEWPCSDADDTAVHGDGPEVSRFECQHLERLPQRIDEPGVPDPFALVNA